MQAIPDGLSKEASDRSQPIDTEALKSFLATMGSTTYEWEPVLESSKGLSPSQAIADQKLILKQSDRRSQIIKSDLPLKETIINWQWEHDPLLLMPYLSIVSFCVFFPLMVLALLLALLANIANYIVKALVALSNGLNEFCYTATDNHTRLSITEENETNI